MSFRQICERKAVLDIDNSCNNGASLHHYYFIFCSTRLVPSFPLLLHVFINKSFFFNILVVLFSLHWCKQQKSRQRFYRLLLEPLICSHFSVCASLYHIILSSIRYLVTSSVSPVPVKVDSHEGGGRHIDHSRLAKFTQFTHRHIEGQSSCHELELFSIDSRLPRLAYQ